MAEVEIDTEKMAELMDKLIKDEAFRQKFQSDPKAVLAEYNMDIPDELIPGNVEQPGLKELEGWLKTIPQQTPAVAPVAPMGMPAVLKEQEISGLESLAQMLGYQLEQIKKRLEELRK